VEVSTRQEYTSLMKWHKWIYELTEHKVSAIDNAFLSVKAFQNRRKRDICELMLYSSTTLPLQEACEGAKTESRSKRI